MFSLHQAVLLVSEQSINKSRQKTAELTGWDKNYKWQLLINKYIYVEQKDTCKAYLSTNKIALKHS